MVVNQDHDTLGLGLALGLGLGGVYGNTPDEQLSVTQHSFNSIAT